MRKPNLTIVLGFAFILAGISILLLRISSSAYSPLQNFFSLLKNKSSISSYLYYFIVNFPIEIQGIFFIIVGIGIAMLKNWARILSIFLCIYYAILFSTIFVISYTINTVPIKTSIANIIVWVFFQLWFYVATIIYLTNFRTKQQFFKKI